MKEIRLDFDYAYGPIWKSLIDTESGELITGVPVIDEDGPLRELDASTREFYRNLYVSDEYGTPVALDRELYEKEKPHLRSMIDGILRRLEELDDGTFVIDDRISGELM